MAKSKTINNPQESDAYVPASPDEEERQMIALAMKRAKERLENGTATSQEIIHFLRLGSSTIQAENEKLRKEIELLTAKTEALQSQKSSEELYSKALEAMRLYRGESDDDEELQ